MNVTVFLSNQNACQSFITCLGFCFFFKQIYMHVDLKCLASCCFSRQMGRIHNSQHLVTLQCMGEYRAKSCQERMKELITSHRYCECARLALDSKTCICYCVCLFSVRQYLQNIQLSIWCIRVAMYLIIFQWPS